MAKRLSSDVYRQLGAICRGGTTSGLSDAELIARFATRTDHAVAEAAFEAIIRRHGPMVLGLCRQIVRDPTDAEDAFQATFVVLARKAGSVRVDDSLGRWLSGTARRVATRASKQARSHSDAEGATVPEVVSAAPGPAEAVIARERAALVREEVARLPDRYRAAVELCHLDGRSIDEASARLGQPTGTIKVRLMRARALLRDRLGRRGFSASDVPLPAVPAVLVHRTVRLVTVDAFGSATVPAFGAMGTGAALRLAEGALVMMGWAKVQGAGAAVLCVGIGAAAVGGWVVSEGEGTVNGTGGPVVVVQDDEGEDAFRSVDDSKVGAVLSSVPERHVLITRLEHAKAVLDGLIGQSQTMDQAREHLDAQIADTERLIEELSAELQGGGSNREEPSLPLSPEPRGIAPIPDTLRVPDRKSPERDGLMVKAPVLEFSERDDLKFFIHVPDEVVIGDSFQVVSGVQNRGKRTLRDLRFVTTVPDALKGADANGEPKELGQFVLPIDLEPGTSFDVASYELVAGEEGEHTIRFEVVGEGIEAGTVAEEVTVTVVQPGLKIQISGPDRVSVGSVGTYSLEVSNSGADVATDVSVALFAPQSGKPAVPSEAIYRQDPSKHFHSIYWRIPRLAKGETKDFRVPIRLDRIALYSVEAAAHSEGFRDQEDTRRVQWTTRVVPLENGLPNFLEPYDEGVQTLPPERSPFDLDPPMGEARSPFDLDPPMDGARTPFEVDEPVVADPFGTSRVQRSPFDVMPDQPDTPGAEGEPLPPETEVIEMPEWTLEQTTPRPVDESLPPEYVVEPPDVLRVEVLEALPGRPITGERVVGPDGRISLGFYGELYVEGLTTTEIKERLVLKLRNFLNDSVIGLVEVNPVTRKPIMIHPRDVNRVVVEVTSFKSRVAYVQGEVERPGRYTLAGRETVLDVLIEAGGPKPGEGLLEVRLIRPSADEGGEAEIREVDWEGIVQRGDSTTNHEVKAGDRIVVERNPDPVALESRIEQQFLETPDVRAIRGEIRAMESQIYEVSKSVRNPNDPALTKLLDERNRLRLRYAELWTRLEPLLRPGSASAIEPEPDLGIGEKLQRLSVELIDIDRRLETARRAASRSGVAPVINPLIKQREALSEEYSQILEGLDSDDRERLAPALRGVPEAVFDRPDRLRTEHVGLDARLVTLRKRLEELRTQPASPDDQTMVELQTEIEQLEASRLELMKRLEDVPDEGDDREGGATGGPETPEQEPEAAEGEKGDG